MTDQKPINSTQMPCLALVAPSGYATDPIAVQRGIDLLRARGCRVKLYCDPSAHYQRFGASDAQRAAQLMAAASDPEVQLVLSLRGGYGISRVLPLLDFSILAQSGKLFVGHSDFTAFQMALLAHGCGSFAGPMLCSDFSPSEPDLTTLNDFWSCVTRPNHVVTVATTDTRPLDVSGMLWGGNLTVLTHLIGSKYFPQIDNGILFVEDINEHPYRVERMLLQLLRCGALAHQQALLLGDFSNYRLTEYDNGYDLGVMLDYLRSVCPIPILGGLPFGHIARKDTLAIGSWAHLIGAASGWQLTMSNYYSLQSTERGLSAMLNARKGLAGQ